MTNKLLHGFKTLSYNNKNNLEVSIVSKSDSKSVSDTPQILAKNEQFGRRYLRVFVDFELKMQYSHHPEILILIISHNLLFNDLSIKFLFCVKYLHRIKIGNYHKLGISVEFI